MEDGTQIMVQLKHTPRIKQRMDNNSTVLCARDTQLLHEVVVDKCVVFTTYTYNLLPTANNKISGQDDIQKSWEYFYFLTWSLFLSLGNFNFCVQQELSLDTQQSKKNEIFNILPLKRHTVKKLFVQCLNYKMGAWQYIMYIKCWKYKDYLTYKLYKLCEDL